MEKVTFAVHCDKYQKKKDGSSALYMRVTINRKTRYLPLSKYINAEHFDFDKKRVKEINAVPNAKALNRFLKAQELIMEDIILDLQRRERGVTFENIKRAFLGGGSENFFQFCMNMLEEDSIDLKEYTIQLDTYKLNKIEAYHPNVSIHEIDESWLKRYKKYLIEKLGNRPNTVSGDFKSIKKFILKALDQGIIKRNPFENISVERFETEKAHLTIEEQRKALEYYKSEKLLQLVKKDNRGKSYYVGRKYQDILQQFLIGCFSGLRISDIATLRRSNIDFENNMLIKRMVKGRKNKEKVVRVPMTEQLKDVLDFNRNDDMLYNGIVRMKAKHDLNRWLREVLYEHIGIDREKHITFHCSRHTFAVTCLTLGMPLETVQDIMGHSDIKTTQIYAKVVEEKRKRDMSDYWSKFNDSGKEKGSGSSRMKVV